MTKKLEFSYDEAADVLTVEGIAYAGELFRTLGFGKAGTWMRLEDRKGCVTIFKPSMILSNEFDMLVQKEKGE